MKKTRLTKQQKKDQLVIILLSVVSLILIVFCVNAFKAENTPVTGSTAPVQTTIPVQPATTAPAPVETTGPVESEPAETTKKAETTKPADTTAPAPADETAEILKVVSDSVNFLKSDEASFTGHKVQSINIHLVDSSVPSVNNIINSVIQAFVKQEILDYDFTNGVSSDPEGDGTVESNSIFPPGSLPFTLTKEGVASATKTADGENTVYTIVIVSESSTLENPRPPYHNSAADTLDLSSVEIPIITLTKVDFDYPGATVAVTLDPDGNIVGYYEKLPMSGTGEGYGLGITGYGTIEGYMEENWDIKMK